MVILTENTAVSSERGASATCYSRAENVGIAPIVVAERKFRDIEWQIFLADFVECAHNAAFDERPEAFNRVGMDCANTAFSNVLSSTVIDGFVRQAMFPAQAMVAGKIVGTQQTDLAGNCLLDEAFKCTDPNIGDDTGDDISLPFYGANNNGLTASAATMDMLAFVPMAIGVFAADVSFINLNYSAKLLFRFDERSADFMTHGMGRPIGAETHHALNLQAAHPLLACQHVVDDAKPLTEGLIRVLENRACNDREAIALIRSASVALPLEGHRFDGENLVVSATRTADAIGPAASLKVALAGVFIWEDRLKLGRCHLGNRLRAAGHDYSPVMERMA